MMRAELAGRNVKPQSHGSPASRSNSAHRHDRLQHRGEASVLVVELTAAQSSPPPPDHGPWGALSAREHEENLATHRRGVVVFDDVAWMAMVEPLLRAIDVDGVRACAGEAQGVAGLALLLSDGAGVDVGEVGVAEADHPEGGEGGPGGGACCHCLGGGGVCEMGQFSLGGR